MKAIILAAGRGSRMGEGTAAQPKCMTRLCGKTLLERCLDSLTAAGLQSDQIGIVTGYRQDVLHAPGVTRFHNPRWEQTNMVISLTMAGDWLIREPCIVVYSDIVFHPNAITTLMRDTHDIAITYYTGFWEIWERRFDDPLSDLETFRLDGPRLLEIGKQPRSREEIMGQYMGLIRITPTGWQAIERAISQPLPKPVERLDMTGLLQHLLELGQPIAAIATDELWLECDNLNDIRVYEEAFADLLTQSPA